MVAIFETLILSKTLCSRAKINSKTGTSLLQCLKKHLALDLLAMGRNCSSQIQRRTFQLLMVYQINITGLDKTKQDKLNLAIHIVFCPMENFFKLYFFEIVAFKYTVSFKGKNAIFPDPQAVEGSL